MRDPEVTKDITALHAAGECTEEANHTLVWPEPQELLLLHTTPTFPDPQSRQHCGGNHNHSPGLHPASAKYGQLSRNLRCRGKGMWAGKGTALGGVGGVAEGDIHKKDFTDHFLPYYFRIIVISCKPSLFPTQLLMATILVWCWPPAMLINGFRIIFIHFAHFTHSTSCDLCSPCSSYFYLNCRASSEF